MDTSSTLLYASFTLLFLFLIIKLLPIGKGHHHQPPSPAAALPIIGHLHLLKQPLHRTFHRLSQTTGSIFSLKLGFRRCVVVSSPRLVEECFTGLDVVLANRPRILVDKYIGYDHRSMVGAPYGAHWRSLRRLAAEELLSPARLRNFLHVRSDEVLCLLRGLLEASDKGSFEPRAMLSELTFNNMMRMIAGKRYSGEDSKEGRKFSKLINEVFEAAQASNPQDFLPFLQWIDYGGHIKKLSSLGKELDEFFQSLIDEHRHEKRKTMIAHLLSLQESQPHHFCSDHTIKGFIMSMLLAGTDTSSATLEWAISNLVNNPHVLAKARAELDAIIGNERLMNEEDLSNLPYLHNIILETFRLFPAAPLLLPHEAAEDCTLGGYDIQRGTLLFVNAWAIHRDPEVWEDATRFIPERFEGRTVETHKLMPFGMGRRACPGTALAHRLVGLVLGSMIQCFEWERVSLEEVDLSEGEGLTMPKLMPLQVMCQPRQIMKKLIVD